MPGRRMFFKWNCVVRNLFLIAILAVFIAASALTAQPLPAPVLHVEPDLKLLGKGELRWFGLHVYDASLWVGGQTWSPNRTYALDLQYARDIPGKRLVDSSIERDAPARGEGRGQARPVGDLVGPHVSRRQEW